MTVEAQNLFELIRREGLIVVAIAALAWQVWHVTTTAANQDRLWREEMAAYRVESQDEAKRRLQAAADIAQAITKLVDRLDRVEQACNSQLETSNVQ